MQNDGAGHPQQFSQQLSSGNLHTPTQSFSESAQTPDSMAGAKVAQWATDKKFREEYDYARSRLSDQKFIMKDYADPLVPRQNPQSKFYPRGVTAETEARLQQVIAKVKGST